MKKVEKKKDNRKKLRSLILLLFLTIVMFSTATYAWFTANQTVTISTLNVHVEASNGLQISSDAATWKTVLTNADITTGYTGHTNQVPTTLSAVSTDGTVDSTAATLNMYHGVVGSNATTGEYNLTATKETEAAGANGNFIAFDMFLKVDQAETIYLTTSSNVVAKDGTEDRGLKNAARVGFVTLGTAAATTPAATLVALKTPAAKAIIWEPNADTHTTYGTTAAGTYAITVGAASTTYYGLNQAISTAVTLKDIMNGTDTTRATKVTPNIITPASYTGTYKSAFALTTGVTKIRVYMWIEGQDVDCENNASGTDIAFNVQLSTQSSGT